MLTTKNYESNEKEKKVDEIKCRTGMSQLFKTLEECCIAEVVKPEYIALQDAIKKALNTKDE